MKEFTLSQDELPFGFFDKVGFEYEDVALRCLSDHFNHLSDSQIEEVFDKHHDDFSELLYDMDEFLIDSYYAGEFEVDEGSGTWGYSKYEVPDLKEVHKRLTAEVESLFIEFVKYVDLKNIKPH